MRRALPLVAVALLVAGCNSEPSVYKAEPTANCLRGKGFRVTTEGSEIGVVAAAAPNGGLRAFEPGNTVTIAFGESSDDALGIQRAFRRFAPKARAYKLWTRAFESIGKVWTAVLLAVIYLFSVGPISVVMRLFARDPLDRNLAQEPSFWRSHEPNPLGPEAAARHQF